MKWDPVRDHGGEALLAAALALGFPELGRSTEGRPIFGRQFGRPFGPHIGRPRRPLLIFGGIHGDEPASVEAMLELAVRLAGEKDPPSLFLIPMVNPDGIAHGTKNSARDVDLNRNFPARSFTTAHAPDYSPGPAPLSEPETRTLAGIVDGHQIRGAVAVHAPLACVNYDGPAAVWAEAVAAACGWPARGDIGYPTPGSFGSWLGLDRGLPVLTLELPAGPLASFRQAAAVALDIAVAGPPDPACDAEPLDK